jgi:hypothetical protein
MRTSMLAAIICLGLVACSDDSGNPGKTADTSVTPAPTVAGAVASSFEATVDVAHQSITFSERTPDGKVITRALPPSGTNATDDASATMHTMPGTVFYGGSCGANVLCGSVQAVSHLTSAATFYVYVDSTTPTGITGGPWVYSNVGAGATSGATTWSFSDPSAANFTFKGHTEIVVPTCNALHAALPSLASGTYNINPQGAPISAYCDMTFDAGDGNGAGGWTLVQAIQVNNGPSGGVAGTTLPGTSTYMPLATMEAVANASAQVHIRAPGLAATQSVTSKVGTPPIVNMRAGGMADGDNAQQSLNEAALWVGPYADAAHLNYTCPNYSNAWPNVYQACGTNGMHLWGGYARWAWNGGGGPNTAFEVYLR